jgi:hypothetical protein
MRPRMTSVTAWVFQAMGMLRYTNQTYWHIGWGT